LPMRNSIRSLIERFKLGETSPYAGLTLFWHLVFLDGASVSDECILTVFAANAVTTFACPSCSTA
jgi:hypothetical protein